MSREELCLIPITDARRCYNRYKDKLSAADKAWMEAFFLGYFRGDTQALQALGASPEQQQSILAERTYASNASHRHKSTERLHRKPKYSPADYVEHQQNPEETLLIVL